MIDFLHYLTIKYIIHDFAFAACVVFLVLWNRLTKIESWVGLLLFGCFFLDLFAASFAYKAAPNLWIYNLGVPIQLLLIVIIYHQLLTSTILKKYLRIGYFVFFILLCVDLLFIQKFNVFNTYVFIPAYLCLAFVSFIYLKNAMENHTESPYKNFFFWFGCATLINYTALVPFIALLTWSGLSEPVWNKVYYLSNLIYCSWFTLISFGIIWTKLRTSSSS